MIPSFLLILRITVSLFSLLFLPGFALSFVLFPNRNTLEGAGRVAVSAGLSIALLILVGYTLNLTPWGIQLGSILAAIGIIVTGASAYCGIRYRHFLKELLHEARRKIRPQNILALGLVIGVVFGLSWLAVAAPGAEPTTEFFVVDHEVQDRHLVLTLSIINYEPAQTTYTLRIRAGDQLLDIAPSVLLASGEQWEETLVIQLPKTSPAGPLRVGILLLRDENTEPYRSLHLWLENGILR
jgi:uncharacterized membrane protein